MVHEIEWRITEAVAPSKIDGYPVRMVNFSFKRAGRAPFTFALKAEDAYDLREEIGRAYDQLV